MDTDLDLYHHEVRVSTSPLINTPRVLRLQGLQLSIRLISFSSSASTRQPAPIGQRCGHLFYDDIHKLCFVKIYGSTGHVSTCKYCWHSLIVNERVARD
jgi:hypothetical protein